MQDRTTIVSKLTDRTGHRRPLGLAVSGGLLGVALGVLTLSGGAAEPDDAAAAGLPASVAAAPTVERTSSSGPNEAPVLVSDPVGPLPPEVDDPEAWVVREAPAEEEDDDERDAALPEPGEPFEADRPVRIVIPAIDVDETVVETGLLSSGAMEVADFGLAGWYGLGPKPGEVGPAVIAAHVSSVAGPDVFYRLDELEESDEIRVEDADGATHVFTVTDSELQPKVELPTERIWSDDDEPVLRLITCGGEFDAAARSHVANVIVYAEQAR